MDRFCIRQMRKEYRGVVLACCVSAVALLLLSAILGAIVRSKHPESRAFVMLLGVQAFIAAAMAGLYLILTDGKRLIRQTPFGQALIRMGDAEQLIRDIDQSARKRMERHGAFTLLQDWLILEYACPWRWEQKRTVARPVRRDQVLGVRTVSGKNPRDPEERRLQIILSDETVFDLYLYQQQDMTALMSWLGERERQTDE